MIEIRPYLLKNKIQNYAWGTKGSDAFIAKLMGIEPGQDTPYAELWMGAHPKAPSQIYVDDKWTNLDEVIDRYPNEMLGDYVCKTYANKLPFLFKVLSAGEPLSIQAHPTIELAKILHAEDPKNYPDENHKPEIAIALDHLTALVGFKPYQDIQTTLELYPGILKLIDTKIIERFFARLSGEVEKEQSNLKEMYSAIINLSETEPEIFKRIIDEIRKTIELKKDSERLEFENLFLQMFGKYGYDIGLVSILFFNLIHLKKDEAIFTPAGLPHAYIGGNIIECMANSDNVIRAGLTPKFKDMRNLIKLMDYRPTYPELVKTIKENNTRTYLSSVGEFIIKSIKLTGGSCISINLKLPVIMLVLNGGLELQWSAIHEPGKMELTRGTSVFIPAGLDEFTLKNKTDSEIFLATVNVKL